ncbi:MAG: hypothetical protein HY079_02745 [Elusimicrobia bacterium]|nr:hypothetical protein [Elusimicrobiota bacterium]
MDFKIVSKDGREAVIPGWGNLPVELMAAVAGVKPVVHAWIDEREKAAIERMCAVLGLKVHVYSHGGKGSGTGRLGVMIGPDPAKLEACAAVWDKPMNNPGEHLGYSACCVKSFWEWNPSFDRKPEADCIVKALKATPKAKTLPWLLNDAYYMYSRPWSQEDVDRRESMVRANPDWPLDLLNVNAWHPCSYACAESLAKAEKTFAAMRKHLPALAAKVEAALKRPVAFWDWHRFAALDGTVGADGSVAYSRVAPPYSLLEKDLRAALDSGDRLVAGDGGLTVFKGKKKVADLKGAYLLPFA